MVIRVVNRDDAVKMPQYVPSTMTGILLMTLYHFRDEIAVLSKRAILAIAGFHLLSIAKKLLK